MYPFSWYSQGRDRWNFDLRVRRLLRQRFGFNASFEDAQLISC